MSGDDPLTTQHKVVVEVPTIFEGSRKFASQVREASQGLHDLVAQRVKEQLLFCNWRWFTRRKISYEDGRVVLLNHSKMSPSDGWKWVERNASWRTVVEPLYLDALYFHAWFCGEDSDEFRSVLLQSGEIIGFDPRDNWRFLGRVHQGTDAEEFLFSKDDRFFGVSRTAARNRYPSGRHLSRHTTRDLLASHGLTIPHQLLESGSVNTLEINLLDAAPVSRERSECPTSGSDSLCVYGYPSDGSPSPRSDKNLQRPKDQPESPDETAATIVTEFLANGLGTIATVLPVSIEAEKETGNKETGEHPGALEDLWPEAVIANLTGQPQTLASLMNKTAANPETEDELTSRRLLNLPKGSVPKEKVAEVFGWPKHCANNNWESLKRRFHKKLDELEAKGITEPRGVCLRERHVVKTQKRPQ